MQVPGVHDPEQVIAARHTLCVGPHDAHSGDLPGDVPLGQVTQQRDFCGLFGR